MYYCKTKLNKERENVMSRPKKEREIVKCRTLQARCTESEFEYYNEMSKKLGMNVSTLVRAALINFLKDK